MTIIHNGLKVIFIKFKIWPIISQRTVHTNFAGRRFSKTENASIHVKGCCQAEDQQKQNFRQKQNYQQKQNFQQKQNQETSVCHNII